MNEAERETLDKQLQQWIQANHDNYIARNRSVFFDDPPADFGNYAYRYYDGNGDALYHGYTSHAVQRAKKHYEEAPWASWVQDVRYRRCSTVVAAQKLEGRLQRKVESLCAAGGRTRAYHGQDWSDLDNEFKTNHVTGTCKLPGGICDPEDWEARLHAEMKH